MRSSFEVVQIAAHLAVEAASAPGFARLTGAEREIVALIQAGLSRAAAAAWTWSARPIDASARKGVRPDDERGPTATERVGALEHDDIDVTASLEGDRRCEPADPGAHDADTARTP